MNKSVRFILAAVIFSFSAGSLFPADKKDLTQKNSDKKTVATVQNSKTEKLKEILYRIVKQDEYLDEAVEKIESKKAKLSGEETTALISSLRLIKTNMEQISNLAKNQLSEVNSDPQLAKYAKTIMIYGSKVNRKSGQLTAYVDSVVLKNRKTMRNAPSSRTVKSKGKKLSAVLKEQKNLENLRAELVSLNKSSGKVKAAGKWLYIASR